jgi:hypothetical protein
MQTILIKSTAMHFKQKQHAMLRRLNLICYFVCTKTVIWQKVRTDINIPDTDRTFVSTGSIVKTCAPSGSATLLGRDVQIPGDRSPIATEFVSVAPNTCSSSVWDLFHVTRLAPKILTWLLGFRNIFALLLLGLFMNLMFYGHLFHPFAFNRPPNWLCLL